MARVLRTFAGNQSGASATEFAMLLPVLLFVLMGSITAFDM
ncbi:MAG: pilus assembly protein, partial [Oxalobacteraceae bacterium]